jgi:hypothetical protein
MRGWVSGPRLIVFSEGYNIVFDHNCSVDAAPRGPILMTDNMDGA